VKDPAFGPETVRVEVPEPPGTLAELKLAVRLASETVDVSVTVPEKPFKEEIVTVETPELPGAK
jgi:hypothetical protein